MISLLRFTLVCLCVFLPLSVFAWFEPQDWGAGIDATICGADKVYYKMERCISPKYFEYTRKSFKEGEQHDLEKYSKVVVESGFEVLVSASTAQISRCIIEQSNKYDFCSWAPIARMSGGEVVFKFISDFQKNVVEQYSDLSKDIDAKLTKGNNEERRFVEALLSNRLSKMRMEMLSNIVPITQLLTQSEIKRLQIEMAELKADSRRENILFFKNSESNNLDRSFVFPAANRQINCTTSHLNNYSYTNCY